MNINGRLSKLEDALNLSDCPQCREGGDQAPADDPTEAAAAFFEPCPKCGRQRTWLDLVEIAEEGEPLQL